MITEIQITCDTKVELLNHLMAIIQEILPLEIAPIKIKEITKKKTLGEFKKRPKNETNSLYKIDKDAMLLIFILFQAIKYSRLNKKKITIKQIMSLQWFIKEGYSEKYVKEFIEKTFVATLFTVSGTYKKGRSGEMKNITYALDAY